MPFSILSTSSIFYLFNPSHPSLFFKALPLSLQYAFVIGIGSLIGSFLSVVVYRLPKQLSLIQPGSHCPQCKQPLLFLDMIPVISYLMLRGRCRICHASIGIHYFFLEIAAASLAAFALWRFGPTIQGIAAFGFLVTLLALSGIDYTHYLLPDSLTLALLWAGLLLNTHEVFTSLRQAVLGAALGYLILWSVYWAFLLIRKKEGLGYGDFKLLAAIGAWLGLDVLPQVLVLASSIGLAIGLLQYARTRFQFTELRLAFGPFLALSAALTLWKPSLIVDLIF